VRRLEVRQVRARKLEQLALIGMPARLSKFASNMFCLGFSD
jgi:hypothetical protein